MTAAARVASAGGIRHAERPMHARGAAAAVPAVMVMMVMWAPGVAWGATHTWVGTAATSSWSLGANWMDGTVPPDDGSADVVFAGGNAAGQIVTLDAPRRVSSLRVTAAGALTLAAGTAGTLRLDGPLTLAANGSVTVEAPLVGPGDAVLGGMGSAMVGDRLITLVAPCVNAGAIRVAGALLVTAAPFVLPPWSTLDVALDGWVDLGGYSQRVAALAGAGVVANTVGSAQLVVGGANATADFAGMLGADIANRGTGRNLALVLTGEVAQRLSGTLQFTGETRVTEGAVLQLDTALPMANVLMVEGGALPGTLRGVGYVGQLHTGPGPSGGGVVAPGSPGMVGTLTAATADLAGASVVLRLSGPDLLDVVGVIAWDAQTRLVVDASGVVAPGSAVTVMQWGSSTGPAWTDTNITVQSGGSLRFVPDQNGSRLRIQVNSGTTPPRVDVVPQNTLVTSERGESATATLTLQAAPAQDVTVAAMSTNAAEGSVQPAQLVFTPQNWDMPHTLTVTGVDDAVADGNQNWQVVLGPAVSADTAWDGLGLAPLQVTNLDDDLVDVVAIQPFVTQENGAPQTFVVRLRSMPSANVDLLATTGDPSEGWVSPPLATLEPSAWQTGVTFAVYPADDDLLDGCVTWPVRFDLTRSPDAAFDGLWVPTLWVCNQDDEGGAAPVATDDAYQVMAGSVLMVPPPGVLANDTDGLTAQVVDPPAGAGLSLDANGGFSLDAQASAPGELSFTYRCTDGVLWSAPATVRITVQPGGSSSSSSGSSGASSSGGGPSSAGTSSSGAGSSSGGASSASSGSVDGATTAAIDQGVYVGGGGCGCRLGHADLPPWMASILMGLWTMRAMRRRS